MKGETLAIAAVLGQIDAFLSEPASALIVRYESLFQRYCPLPDLYEALSGRGELADILAQAARLAQGTHEVVGGPGGLQVIFGGLSVEEGEQAPLYYPVRPLSTDQGMFPVSTSQGDPGALAAQRAAFYQTMDRIAQNPPKNGADFVQLLDTVLQTYTWCLPGRWGDGDVSLYDTARITAAIAACLGQHQGGEHPFLLISGDFSGIQSYIFAAARTSSREVAKRLRARSFLIDATISALAHTAVRRLEVPCQNLLMLCGGKFQLLAPNRPEQVERLEALRRETDRYLFERYKGEISVNLAWITFGPEGFSDYGGTVTRLAQRLREEKNRPFAGQLAGVEGWREEAFSLYGDLSGKHLCPACQSRLIPREEETCGACAIQAAVGGRLTRADTLWYSHRSGEVELLEDCYLSFSPPEGGNVFQVVRLNSWEVPPELTCYPLVVRPMASNLPAGPEGEPLTFSQLAAQSPGGNQLGVFKADVDNLGYLFADGFRGSGQGGTVGRVVTLSRMLELFFAGYVNTLIKQEYPTVYSVFSGGDDLFLIGPWDTLAHLAVKLEGAFKAFAGQNPCVTLSGALTIAPPKTHIAALAEDCEARLKQVKDQPPGPAYPDKDGRDAVYFMGQIFTWDDLKGQLETARRLEQAARGGNVSILRRVMRYSQMYQEFLRTGDVFQLMYDPLFFYDRKRNFGELLKQNRWLSGYIDRLAENAADRTRVNRPLYFAQTAVRCALATTKEVRKYGASSSDP